MSEPFFGGYYGYSDHVKLVRNIGSFLETLGFKVNYEVGNGRKRHDIVASKDGVYWAIEIDRLQGRPKPLIRKFTYKLIAKNGRLIGYRRVYSDAEAT